MTTKFIILSSQRTGSTYLSKLLDSHPSILCPGEILFRRAGNKYAITTYMRGHKSRIFDYYVRRGAFLNSFLDSYCEYPDYEAIGFKLMYSQTRRVPYRFPSAVDYISNHGFRVIHNIRKNYLRVLLSRERSRGSGIYHTSQKVSYDKQPVDIGSLINNLQNMKNEDDTWKKKFGGLPYMEVDYEKLVLNPEIQTNQVLSFLGVEKQEKLSTDFVRLSPESIDNLVSNYGEVCSILAGTEFEYCIIEDGK